MGLLAYAISKFSSGKAVVIVTAVGVLGCLGTLIVLAVRAKRFGQIVGRVAGTLIAGVLGMYLVLFGLIYFSRTPLPTKRTPSSSRAASRLPGPRCW